jgi:hypothetical protein
MSPDIPSRCAEILQKPTPYYNIFQVWEPDTGVLIADRIGLASPENTKAGLAPRDVKTRL